MFINKIGSMAALAIGAVTLLTAADAEAARCHRHRRACCYEPCVTVCCDPCATTCCDPCMTSCPAPCATTWCDPCRGTVVIERAVVSGCCVASAPAATEVIAASGRSPSAATVSLARAQR